MMMMTLKSGNMKRAAGCEITAMQKHRKTWTISVINCEHTLHSAGQRCAHKH